MGWMIGAGAAKTGLFWMRLGGELDDAWQSTKGRLLREELGMREVSAHPLTVDIVHRSMQFSAFITQPLYRIMKVKVDEAIASNIADQIWTLEIWWGYSPFAWTVHVWHACNGHSPPIFYGYYFFIFLMHYWISTLAPTFKMNH